MAQDPTDAVLGDYRRSIDNIDAALVYLLSERFKVTKKVGLYKSEKGLPPADKAREREQVRRLRRLAREADLDPDFTEKFLAFIIDEVIRNHEKLGARAVPSGSPSPPQGEREGPAARQRRGRVRGKPRGSAA